MPSSGTFSGAFRLDDRLVADAVEVVLNDYEVVLLDARKLGIRQQTLCLYPVSPKMFSHVGSAERMREGFFHAAAGTSVGGLSYGPLGHPGDGEFDHRPITEFVMTARFTRQELFIRFSGTTEAGIGGMRGFFPKLAPSAFEVSFVVPRAQMLGFLQIESEKYFIEKLDKC